jgi:hypothetical protein
MYDPSFMARRIAETKKLLHKPNNSSILNTAKFLAIINLIFDEMFLNKNRSIKRENYDATKKY